MIRLYRDRTSVDPHFFGRERVAREKKLIEEIRTGSNLSENGSQQFDTSYWKHAKPQLVRESHGKCAYCESPYAAVGYGDVEHFRPKSKYWWLAYCYDNYLHSCAICNQQYKKAKFASDNPMTAWDVRGRMSKTRAVAFVGMLAPDPVEQEACEYPWSHFMADVVAEGPHLVDPYREDEDPENFFVWTVDEDNKWILVAPRDPSNRRHAVAVKSVRDTFGLDRRQLREARFGRYLDLHDVAVTVRTLEPIRGQGPKIVQAIELLMGVLRRARLGSAPYSAMAKYFIDEVWKIRLEA